MEQWYKLSGVLVYDPVRLDFKKSHKTKTLIVQLPRDTLDLYYQWLIKRQFGTWLELQRPMYGLHVTVVKGNERINVPACWKKHVGETVEILVGTHLRRNFQFWNLPVRSQRLNELRCELGLREDFPFHLTVGRQYEWQPT